MQASSALRSPPGSASAHTREAGAHVHGKAELAIVVEGDTATLEFRSPMHDVVGFERAPRNEAERRAWASAAAIVREPGRLFALDKRAGCAPVSQELGLLASSTAPAADARDGFSDLEVSYIYRCRSGAKLAEVEATAFAAFPKIEQIDVVLLQGARQAAGAMTPKNRTFRAR